MSASAATDLPQHAHRQPSIFARWPVLTGVAMGVVTLAPHAFLAPEASVGYAAIVIALIAGIYFGFAVMNGSPRDQFVEFNVAGLFTLGGVLGLLLWPVLLPMAYLAHGLWDFAHHNRLRLPLVSIPTWYVPWCAVIDAIVGAGLIVIWRGHGLI